MKIKVEQVGQMKSTIIEGTVKEMMEYERNNDDYYTIKTTNVYRPETSKREADEFVKKAFEKSFG